MFGFPETYKLSLEELAEIVSKIENHRFLPPGSADDAKKLVATVHTLMAETGPQVENKYPAKGGGVKLAF